MFWVAIHRRQKKETGNRSSTQQTRHVDILTQQWSLPLYSACMCTIEGNNGTIAATGTTRILPLLVVSICDNDFIGTIAGNRHYSTGTIEGPRLYLDILPELGFQNLQGASPQLGHARHVRRQPADDGPESCELHRQGLELVPLPPKQWQVHLSWPCIRESVS